MSKRFLLLLLLVTPVISFAQEPCGDIVTDFGEIETTQIVDCDDPFQEIDGPEIASVVITANGQELVADRIVQLSPNNQTIEFDTSITFSNQPENVFVYTYLFEKQGQDYVMVGDSRSGQLTVADVSAGEYVLVVDIEGVPVLSRADNWLQKIQSWLIPQVYAQFAPFSFERVATSFSVVVEEIEPQCGSRILIDENENEISREVITDCDNPFDEIDGDTVFNVIPDLMQEPFMDLTDGVVVPVESLPADVSFSSRYSVPAGTTNLREVFGVLYQHLPNGDYTTYSNRTVNTTYFVPESGTYTFVLSISLGNDLGELELSERVATTFTIEELDPEPEGASSVLFLPGMQASRLYEDGLLGTEDRLWEPNGNGDVRQLEMTTDGESINDIYTRDIIENVFGVDPVYDNFIELLDDLQEEEQVIEEYVSFAYDWRQSVFDVATEPVKYPDGDEKRLLDEVLRLAEDSYTEKVTIIGHSNGGLVAKALLEEYGDNELAGIVDKLVMIGTPQLGTPKAIGVMAHGTDQEKVFGLVIDDEVARDVIQNMPGAYTLLPSQKYFSAVSSEPVVFADDSEEAASVRDYGEITNREVLNEFLLDSQNSLPNDPTINEPLTLNTGLLQAASTEQNILDDWQAPEGVEVYEAVGTGLATIAGFEYREFACATSAACLFGTFMKPYPVFTNEGDETVVAGSAEAYDGGKTTLVVNLADENAGISFNRDHVDLTESPAVQTFIESVIKYPYVTEAIVTPEFSEVASSYTIVGTHSPVVPRIVTSDGDSIGHENDSVLEEVIGSQYLELGGSTYLIIPATVEDYTIELIGTDVGPYTLTIEQLDVNNERSSVAHIVASSSSNLLATLTFSDGDFGNLLSDYNGDGVVDEERMLDGELVVDEVVYSYVDLHATIETITHRSTKRSLKWLATKAEWYNEKTDLHPVYSRLEKRLLVIISKAILVAERRGRIDENLKDRVEEIVNFLLDQFEQ